tara:strand:+ start:2167 stop:2604 length:438 start_codon:yes stop_codon:yes gene_type:complete
MAYLGNSNSTWLAPLIGGFVSNITTSYNSWSSYNTSYYKWTVPSAGVYELHASLRTRNWGAASFQRYVVYRTSDGSRNGDHVRMAFEQAQNASAINVQQHFVWIVDTTANGDTWYLQGNANSNSSGHSIQSDGNGYNQCWWRRLN